MKLETKHILGKISLFVAETSLAITFFEFVELIRNVPYHCIDMALLKPLIIVFFPVQVLAVIVGILGWQSKFGKGGVLASVVNLIIGVYLLISFIYIPID